MYGVNDEQTEIIRRYWDRRAATFDCQAGHGLVSNDQRRAWLDLLSRFSGKSYQVLDIGCGTGFLALRFAELGHSVTGIDLSPLMIDRARSKAERAGLKIDFRVGDASAIDCDDEIYDIVVARHVLWNLPDPERGVAEWLRVLRPRGRLIVIEGKWTDNEAVGIKRRHTAAAYGEPQRGDCRNHHAQRYSLQAARSPSVPPSGAGIAIFGRTINRPPRRLTRAVFCAQYWSRVSYGSDSMG